MAAKRQETRTKAKQQHERALGAFIGDVIHQVAEDQAGVVSFLASDDAAFMTGQTMQTAEAATNVAGLAQLRAARLSPATAAGVPAYETPLSVSAMSLPMG